MNPQPKNKPRARLGAKQYRKLCDEIHERDGWKCRRCKSRMNLTNHHIIFRSQGGPDTHANCITLCNTCHEFVHRMLLVILPLKEGQTIDANRGVRWGKW